MSRGVFDLHFIGRAGNQLFEYAFARGYCEMHGIELHTDPWVGEQIFDISHPRCVGDLPRRDENTLVIGERDISYRSYSQRQRCADYYGLFQLMQWFTWHPHISNALQSFRPLSGTALAHIRRGDYAGSGYPLVSKNSYQAAFALSDAADLQFVCEEDPATHRLFTGDLAWVPDFYRMSNCTKLYRANSSFSFWAGTLAVAHYRAQVYSPIITGLAGGIEHDCQFQPDNWARIAELDCVEQITIKP
jgi:hypothetical protein